MRVLFEVDYYKKHVKSFFDRVKSPHLNSFERTFTSMSFVDTRLSSKLSISTAISDESTVYNTIFIHIFLLYNIKLLLKKNRITELYDQKVSMLNFCWKCIKEKQLSSWKLLPILEKIDKKLHLYL